MNNNLFFSDILFVIITTIAALVAWQLYKSKNGMLRKIMIAYFLVEVFIYSASAVFYYRASVEMINVTVDIFRLIVLTPKAAVMLWLLWWLKQTKQ